MPEITTIILSGGKATRMKPLSIDKCKSMISFMGKPLLFYLIKALQLNGFLDVVFTSSGKDREIEGYFSHGENFGIKIQYCDSDKWYGTAGTVKKLVDIMKEKVSNTFMVIYGDSLLSADYEKMFQFHREKKSWCTILFHRPDFKSFLYEYHDKSFKECGKRTNYGILDIDSNNRVTNIKEKPLVDEIKRDFKNPVANAAVYILEKKILDFIPSDQSCDFPLDLFPLIVEKGIPCFGFDTGEGYRIDIGTIVNYYNSHFAILKGYIKFGFYFPQVENGIWVGNSSEVCAKESLKRPVIIGEKSKINFDTTIENSIIGNNVYIGKYSYITNSIILDNVCIEDNVRISNSIIGENSNIEEKILLPPNTVLGSYCRIGGSELLMKDSDFLGLIRR